MSPTTGGPVDTTMSHRRGSRQLQVLAGDGSPLPGASVIVQQSAHEFAFGNIGFDFVPPPESGTGSDPGLTDLAELWLDLFNTATLPFYWSGFEPERGAPRTAELQASARWFADHGVAVKGHPLVWHTLAAPWLLELEVGEIEREQRERIRREVGDFAGTVAAWDVINEVVIMPVFDNGANGITRLCRERGRIATVRMAFEEARAADPAAVLLINDFDLSSAYECLIEGLLEAGIPIDAIGLQTHMHQGYPGEEDVLATVDRFARYGLPLHLTETTLLSGDLMPPEIEDLNDYRVTSWPSTPEGESRQADEIVRHYRSLVSHPAVEAITYWGLTDRDAWLGAPVGLVRADGTRKPSYDALHDLIKREWWMAPTPLRTDEEGIITVEGFRGAYRAEASGHSVEFAVGSGDDHPAQLTVG